MLHPATCQNIPRLYRGASHTRYYVRTKGYALIATFFSSFVPWGIPCPRDLYRRCRSLATGIAAGVVRNTTEALLKNIATYSKFTVLSLPFQPPTRTVFFLLQDWAALNSPKAVFHLFLFSFAFFFFRFLFLFYSFLFFFFSAPDPHHYPILLSLPSSSPLRCPSLAIDRLMNK